MCAHYDLIRTARCSLCTQENALELYHKLCQFIQQADWNQVKLAGAQSKCP